MFRQIAASIPGGAELLFRLHPVELSGLLEQAWEFRQHEHANNKPIGDPNRRSDIPGLPSYIIGKFPNYGSNLGNFRRTPDSREKCQDGCVKWHHLIYAFCIEQTRVFDICRLMLHKFRHGEELGVPIEGSEHWLRNTEELFFRDAPPFFINALTSSIRPSLDASRRNAYFRMFGMDLTHGTEDNKPYSFVKPKAANAEFVTTFEKFLREVWIGIANFNNSVGINITDEAEIANHAEKLHDMLRTRRLTGNLAREEFCFVSMMSWFHLTLETNSPIVLSLRADGVSPEQRLFKIAERVKLPAHALSKNFFDLSEAISAVLILLETGIFNKPDAVPALYDPDFPDVTGISRPIVPLMRTIITHWSITTGRDLKLRSGSDNTRVPASA